jgi:hypothetical protein
LVVLLALKADCVASNSWLELDRDVLRAFNGRPWVNQYYLLAVGISSCTRRLYAASSVCLGRSAVVSWSRHHYYRNRGSI